MALGASCCWRWSGYYCSDDRGERVPSLPRTFWLLLLRRSVEGAGAVAVTSTWGRTCA